MFLTRREERGRMLDPFPFKKNASRLVRLKINPGWISPCALLPTHVSKNQPLEWRACSLRQISLVASPCVQKSRSGDNTGLSGGLKSGRPGPWACPRSLSVFLLFALRAAPRCACALESQWPTWKPHAHWGGAAAEACTVHATDHCRTRPHQASSELAECVGQGRSDSRSG